MLEKTFLAKNQNMTWYRVPWFSFVKYTFRRYFGRDISWFYARKPWITMWPVCERSSGHRDTSSCFHLWVKTNIWCFRTLCLGKVLDEGGDRISDKTKMSSFRRIWSFSSWLGVNRVPYKYKLSKNKKWKMMKKTENSIPKKQHFFWNENQREIQGIN